MKEEWKDVKGYEGLYQVSNLGEVKSFLKGGCIRKQRTTRQGYKEVTLNDKGRKQTLKVHRLVAIAFIENPLRKKEVNHINCIKDDNKLSNLEWCTPKENSKHAINNGLLNSRNGVLNGNCKLTEDDVLKIKHIIKLNIFTQLEIGEMFNVSQGTISAIKNNRVWSGLKEEQKGLKYTLFEYERLEDDLWEVFTTWFWNNGTTTPKDVSHHASKREAEEQRTINKFKTLGK